MRSSSCGVARSLRASVRCFSCRVIAIVDRSCSGAARAPTAGAIASACCDSGRPRTSKRRRSRRRIYRAFSSSCKATRTAGSTSRMPASALYRSAVVSSRAGARNLTTSSKSEISSCCSACGARGSFRRCGRPIRAWRLRSAKPTRSGTWVSRPRRGGCATRCRGWPDAPSTCSSSARAASARRSSRRRFTR